MHPRTAKVAKAKNRSGATADRAALQANGAATKKSPARPSGPRRDAVTAKARRHERGDPVGDYYRLMMDWSPLGLILRQQALLLRAWSGTSQRRENGPQTRSSRRT